MWQIWGTLTLTNIYRQINPPTFSQCLVVVLWAAHLESVLGFLLWIFNHFTSLISRSQTWRQTEVTAVSFHAYESKGSLSEQRRGKNNLLKTQKQAGKVVKWMTRRRGGRQTLVISFAASGRRLFLFFTRSGERRINAESQRKWTRKRERGLSSARFNSHSVIHLLPKHTWTLSLGVTIVELLKQNCVNIDSKFSQNHSFLALGALACIPF